MLQSLQIPTPLQRLVDLFLNDGCQVQGFTFHQSQYEIMLENSGRIFRMIACSLPHGNVGPVEFVWSLSNLPQDERSKRLARGHKFLALMNPDGLCETRIDGDHLYMTLINHEGQAQVIDPVAGAKVYARVCPD